MSEGPGTCGASLQEDQAGLTTVEYIIILVLIATTSIAMWRQFGEQVEFQIRTATTEINSLN
ncbi:MAG: hypothetical protein AAF447_08065 [Myxococcota bacterium]